MASAGSFLRHFAFIFRPRGEQKGCHAGSFWKHFALILGPRGGAMFVARGGSVLGQFAFFFAQTVLERRLAETWNAQTVLKRRLAVTWEPHTFHVRVKNESRMLENDPLRAARAMSK